MLGLNNQDNSSNPQENIRRSNMSKGKEKQLYEARVGYRKGIFAGCLFGSFLLGQGERVTFFSYKHLILGWMFNSY